MKNKIYLAYFLLLVLALQNGYSQDDRWRYIASNEYHTIYLDTRTVSHLDPYNPNLGFQVWLKWYCLKDCHRSSKDKTVEFFMTKSLFKCNTRLLCDDNVTIYYTDGSIEETASDKNWVSVIPESAGEVVMEHICNNYK